MSYEHELGFVCESTYRRRKRMRLTVSQERKRECGPYIPWDQDYFLQQASGDPEIKRMINRMDSYFPNWSVTAFILSYLACYFKKAYYIIELLITSLYVK